MGWLKAWSVNGYLVQCNKSPAAKELYSQVFVGVCLRVCANVYVCLFVYVCVFRERSSPRDTHEWTNTFSACLPSLNELSRSCEKGSSFLALISNKMNSYARFAIHSIFYLSFPIKALNFTFRWQWTMHRPPWRSKASLEETHLLLCPLETHYG